ncbi:hypothetical protein Patl1_11230 [Pistacia atlantica]|uniref:Uncharacterized protein n=1 Tax=Pistacia atlantica TaxID=434234 RepID=A0ACC1A6N8_9ROSI|nr:hypothetical protein Patl1_11230 [Pistacia atlantica]
MGISIFNLDGETSLAPFEMVSLMIEALAWCSVVVMIGLETKIYVREFRWYVRFGVIYVLIGDAVVLNLILPMMDYYNSYTVIVLNGLCTKVLFGILLFAYVPNLQSHPGYNLLQDESLDNVEYEALPGGEHGWFDIFRFQKCWVKESQRAKPWLLRALNSSLGGRFWLGGFFKIVYDLSQFVMPVLLNHLLQSMQRGDPAWIGSVYAFLIFIGVSIGVPCEAHFFQNVWRVGFRLRSTLVAAIFHKSLRLTHESRKNFPSGKITNMITTDATALQQMCQQLHGLWSAPFRITMAMVLLYQQLGAASLLGSLMLVLMVPVQCLFQHYVGNVSDAMHGRRASNLEFKVCEMMSCHGFVKHNYFLWYISLLLQFNSFILSSIPVVVVVVSFGTFTLLGGDLTPARAFTSLSTFAVLRYPLNMLPNLLSQVANANVSLQHLEELLLAEERILVPNPPLEPGLPAVSIKNGFFSWDSKSQKPTLSDINLDIPVGSLVAIVGGTGEGKTSLISAMLGELPPSAYANVAYVPQVSWTFNGTVSYRFHIYSIDTR